MNAPRISFRGIASVAVPIKRILLFHGILDITVAVRYGKEMSAFFVCSKFSVSIIMSIFVDIFQTFVYLCLSLMNGWLSTKTFHLSFYSLRYHSFAICISDGSTWRQFHLYFLDGSGRYLIFWMVSDFFVVSDLLDDSIFWRRIHTHRNKI
jgi:hypothetical protein